MKKFLSFVRKALFMVTVVVIAVAFEGCGEVADKTIDEIKYIPAQMFTTRETAETAQTDERITSPEPQQKGPRCGCQCGIMHVQNGKQKCCRQANG